MAASALPASDPPASLPAALESAKKSFSNVPFLLSVLAVDDEFIISSVVKASLPHWVYAECSATDADVPDSMARRMRAQLRQYETALIIAHEAGTTAVEALGGAGRRAIVVVQEYYGGTCMFHAHSTFGAKARVGKSLSVSVARCVPEPVCVFPAVQVAPFWEKCGFVHEAESSGYVWSREASPLMSEIVCTV